MKLCPQCAKQNRLGAKFCGACGHTFTVPRQQAKSSKSRLPLIIASLAALLMLVLITGLLLMMANGQQNGNTAVAVPTTEPIEQTSTPQPPTEVPATAAPPTPLPTATPVSNDALNRALLATVQIIVPGLGFGQSSAGSGNVLTTQGHILTNFHVIGDPDSGQLYNAEGRILIALSPPDLREAAEPQYIAQLLEENRSLDLALIKIIATLNGAPLPADLGLTTLPIGNSDSVTIGNELSIIGFPGLGGNSVTFTRGTVSGFITEAGENWIKTDAEINFGNSGGAAINGAGELVGIPSAAAGETVDLPGKIGLVRPVNLARPLIDRALAEAN